MKQCMGQQWNQGRYQKIPWNQWKWGHSNTKSVGQWESRPKRKIHSIAGLFKIQEKTQII